ncbi:MAG TPA: TRAP transporter small permease [Amaricoccus sp.]|uniref:TRAP transporter small permease n=1 Tax=Amaricoccus sp. TaxID=1872485 RepID=UPI001D610FDD|nr:TRAP transporter small permease [Amaricoccus sp.]MCB1372682.1 TRAP transporter small permease [Paracoccaceae bacterium]MCC0065817.1 TRAP transporter small permease [Rhodovulum sp.]HPG21714.1 TRAP transporter small permease [Amaricoccus sp.]HRW14436.1 TRAP transporter small permease [Amaricoccus sp.]
MPSFLAVLGRWLDRAEKTLVVFLVGGIVLLVFSGALSRYVFSYSIAWSEELARYFFLWGALFGAAAACRFGQHGGIPLLVDRFPPKLQRAVEVLVIVGMLSFLGYLTWQSWEATARAFASGQTSLTTKIPIWVVNAGMFAAFALSILRTIQGFLRGAYRIDQPVVE